MLSGLETERQNRASSDLDKMNALEIATLMNRQDARVLRAVRQALPSIAQAIDVVRDRLAARSHDRSQHGYPQWCPNGSRKLSGCVDSDRFVGAKRHLKHND